MIFIFNNKKYVGKTAVTIIREVESDTVQYSNKGGTIRDFLTWSLARLVDHIPLREMDVSANLSNETNAFNFLCLLDNYGIGKLYETNPTHSSSAIITR